MKLRVISPVLDYEGKPAKTFDAIGKEIGVLTWREVIFVACNSMESNEQMSTENKMRAYRIVAKVYQTSEPDFTVEERAFIKERIAKFYSPLVVGRAEEIFEKVDN